MWRIGREPGGRTRTVVENRLSKMYFMDGGKPESLDKNPQSGDEEQLQT